MAPMIGPSCARPLYVAAIATVGLLLCGCDTAIDVGPAGDTDPCSSISSFCDRPPPQGQMTYTTNGLQVSLTPKAARWDGVLLALRATDADGLELDIRVWAGSSGSFRCEDPATAGRTRIDLIGPNYSYFLSTIAGGHCDIEIMRLPSTGDPLLEGTFSGLLPVQDAPGGTETSLDLGSFHVDVPPPYNRFDTTTF
jgi:hypothetical protein